MRVCACAVLACRCAWRDARALTSPSLSRLQECPAVTHVVTSSGGTSKVAWARSTGRYAVRPDFLLAAKILGRRMDEAAFAVS